MGLKASMTLVTESRQHEIWRYFRTVLIPALWTHETDTTAKISGNSVLFNMKGFNDKNTDWGCLRTKD